jgi:hypothetical protein
MEQIERIVVDGIISLQKCLWDEPESYWPQEGMQNSLPERNLSVYVGHMFLKNEWRVFAEASYPKRTDRRLDLLAFKKGVLVAGECKQLDMPDRAKDFSKDAQDLTDFRLTDSWNTDKYQAPRIDRRYGLLLAMTWSPEVRAWWKLKKRNGALPRSTTGDGWRSLGERLDEIAPLSGDQWLNRNEKSDEPDFWALYAIFKLPD